MGILRTVVWSALCVGFGVFLASHTFSGHTAVEHAERALKGKVKLDDVKEDVEGALDTAKKKFAGAKDEAPTEKHSEQDRDAVNRLIARRKP
jgi:hypothetical protein